MALCTYASITKMLCTLLNINTTIDEWLKLAIHAPHIHAALTDSYTANQSKNRPIKRAYKRGVKKQQIRGKAKKPKPQPPKQNFDDMPECGFDEVDQSKIDADIDECGSGDCNILKQYWWHIINIDGTGMKSAPLWSFIEDASKAAFESFESIEYTSINTKKMDQLLPPPVELYKMAYTQLARKCALVSD